MHLMLLMLPEIRPLSQIFKCFNCTIKTRLDFGWSSCYFETWKILRTFLCHSSKLFYGEIPLVETQSHTAEGDYLYRIYALNHYVFYTYGCLSTNILHFLSFLFFFSWIISLEIITPITSVVEYFFCSESIGHCT